MNEYKLIKCFLIQNVYILIRDSNIRFHNDCSVAGLCCDDLKPRSLMPPSTCCSCSEWIYILYFIRPWDALIFLWHQIVILLAFWWQSYSKRNVWFCLINNVKKKSFCCICGTVWNMNAIGVTGSVYVTKSSQEYHSVVWQVTCVMWQATTWCAK